jgi:hypothetical protein
VSPDTLSPGARELLESYGERVMGTLSRLLYGHTMPARSPTDLPSLADVRSASARDAVLEAALRADGMAPHLFDWEPVVLTHGTLRGTVYVSPDWVGFGGPEVLFRVPLKARAAWRVVTHHDCVLPTQRIVDAIHAQGRVRLPFAGLRTWAQEHHLGMDDVAVWQAFNDRLEHLRQGRTGLVTDGAKDTVMGAMQRRAFPAKVCIYGGWEEGDAEPVQSLSTVHSATYGDYSQCTRMVRRMMDVEGEGPMAVRDVAAHPVYYPLLLDTDPRSLERATAPLRAIGYG